jgi:integrase
MSQGYSIESRKGKKGSTYYCRVRYKGDEASDHFKTNAAAHKWGRETVKAIDDGVFNRFHGNLSKMTFAEGVDRYLDEDLVKEKKGYSTERDRGNKIKRYKFANLPLSKIQTSDLAAFRKERMNEINPRTGNKLAPQTIRNDFIIIRSVFNYAISEWGFNGMINPAIGVKLPKPSKARVKRLEDGEAEAILETAEAMVEQPWLAPFISFALETGMRLSEICRIEVPHYKSEQKIVFLPDSKNGEARDIPLPPRAIKVLEDFKPFWGKNTLFGVKSGTVQQAWKKVKTKLEEEGRLQNDWHFHDFRHEACSRFHDWYGMDMGLIQMISGHKDLNMLRRYVNLKPETVAKKFEELDFSHPDSEE